MHWNLPCFAALQRQRTPGRWSPGGTVSGPWVTGPRFAHRSQAWGRHSDRGAAVGKGEAGLSPFPHAIRELTDRAPRQNTRDLLPFIKSLSVPQGGSRGFRPEDTQFPAPFSQWKSEQSKSTLTLRSLGPRLEASHRLPRWLGPGSPHRLPAAQELISRGSGCSAGRIRVQLPEPQSSQATAEFEAEGSSPLGQHQWRQGMWVPGGKQRTIAGRDAADTAARSTLTPVGRGREGSAR